VLSVSLERSNASGAACCMPKAVSKERMRASQGGVSGPRRLVLTIGLGEQVEFEPLQLHRGDAWPHVRDRRRARDDVGALMATGQKIGAPGLCSGIGGKVERSP